MDRLLYWIRHILRDAVHTESKMISLQWVDSLSRRTIGDGPSHFMEDFKEESLFARLLNGTSPELKKNGNEPRQTLCEWAQTEMATDLDFHETVWCAL